MARTNAQETYHEETISGAIIIFCIKTSADKVYLVVKNTKTGNVSFISGAKEPEDVDLVATAKREITEELGVTAENYQLIPTTITHDFIFGSKKTERAGKKGSYQVFWANGAMLGPLHITKELTSAMRLTQEEVLKSLSFDGLKDVFKKTLGEIKV